MSILLKSIIFLWNLVESKEEVKKLNTFVWGMTFQPLSECHLGVVLKNPWRGHIDHSRVQ